MPRNGSGVYSKPPNTTAQPNTTIRSAMFNSVVDDLAADANDPRPVTAGGTGVSSVEAARGVLSLDYKVVYAEKSADYTAVEDDNNAVHRFTAAATVSLTAAATMGANWHYTIIADGGDVVINPNGSETVNGAATWLVPNGTSAFIICSGSAFSTGRGEVKAELDYVSGLVPASVSTTSLSISIGVAFFAGMKQTFASAFTKTMAVPWAAGTGNGLLDTGAMGASKTYHLWVLRNGTTGAGDFIASLSNTHAGVAAPSGWTVLPNSRIGSFLTNASSQIIPWKQYGSRVKLIDAITEFSIASSFNNPFYNPAGTPSGISVDARFLLSTAVGANSSANFRADTEVTGNSAGDASLAVNVVTAVAVQVGQRCRTMPSGLIWIRGDVHVGTATQTLITVGWDDYIVPRMGA